jgi:hypothetical protein
MLRPRILLPLIIPSLIICIPAVAYIVGRSAGTLPTRVEWQSAAHSSGPWMGSDVFTACYILCVGGLLLTACGVAFAATTGRGAQLQGWAIQGIGIVITSMVVFYFFGWLFE